MNIKSLFETKKQMLLFVLLQILCIFPLLVFHVQSKVIIVWALVSFFIMFKVSKQKFRKENLKLYFINTSWIFWLLLTLIYSKDFFNGIKEFERIIALLIIPFILFFFSYKITAQQRFILFLTFTLSLLCFTIYSYVYIINFFKNHYYSLHISGKEFDLWHYFKFHLKVSKLYLYENGVDNKFLFFYHKSYYSLSLIFGISFLVYRIIKKQKYRVCFTLITLFFVFMLFVHVSKAHILVFLFLAILGLIFYNTRLNLINKRVAKILVLFFISGCGLFYYIADKNSSQLGASFINRSNINKCSFELMEQKPLFGYGFGGLKKSLVSCYEERLKTNSNYYYPFIQKQNTHNYFFYIYLSSGIVGVFLFLLMVYHNLIVAIENKDVLYLFFLIGFFITLLFENSLYRIYGVLYFSIFNSIFLQKYLKQP